MTRARLTRLALALAPLALIGLAIEPAYGALGPRHGGTLTLPSPSPAGAIDPTRVETPFEATLADAVFDGLYEVRDDGRVEAVLAEGPPEIEGTVARIHLRPGVLTHARRPLTAEHVVRSLRRVASSPSGWLLGAFATEGGEPAIREVGPLTIEIELARRGVRVDILLAARPLAIVTGGAAGRPIGTGAFSARRQSGGATELRIFRLAPDGAPWLSVVRFAPPVARDDELRSFELGRLDGSWWGRSLYGGAPPRPVATTSSSGSGPLLLVRNDRGALRDRGAFGAVARAIDRRRLERVGLAPSDHLMPGLPPPALATGPLPSGLRLRMLVRQSRPIEGRVAEAIAGMLDERGVRLAVDRVSDTRYPGAVAQRHWDLRLASVRPPLPGRGALAGAALAACGQADEAQRLAPLLGDRAVAERVARELDAAVLGHERAVLHHRADLRDVDFDFSGRLSLADLHFVRGSR